MHKLIATSTILEHELSELRLLVERQTGVVLDCPNSALAAHVADYVEAQGLGSSTTLLERLRSADQDPASLPSLLDGLVNVNTGFFRHPGALNALARHVVPQLCARKSADGPSPLRIWSAGCGSGEETYSIAMAVCDALSHNGSAGTNGNASSNGNGNGSGKSAARSGGIAESAAAILGKSWRQDCRSTSWAVTCSRTILKPLIAVCTSVRAGWPAAGHHSQLLFQDQFAGGCAGSCRE